jgi:hypothetical protein
VLTLVRDRCDYVVRIYPAEMLKFDEPQDRGLCAASSFPANRWQGYGPSLCPRKIVKLVPSQR